MDLKQEGFTKESTVMWVLGSNTELTVNSPAHKKPKKSQAACSPQHQMVSSGQIQTALNGLQKIHGDREAPG